MKNIKKFCCVLFSLILFSNFIISCSKQTEKNDDNITIPSDMSPEDIGSMLLNQLFIENNYGGIAKSFSRTDDMDAFITISNLKDLQTQITALNGEFTGITNVTSTTVDEYDVVSYVCSAELSSYKLNITFNKNKEIAGIHYDQIGAVDNLKNKNGVKISTGTGDYPLPGILQYEEDKPISDTLIIIVPGSGPNDIDGTVGVLKPYDDLANGFVSMGYAVYRYEKRTYYYSDKFTSDTVLNMTPYEEYIEDLLITVRMFMTGKNYDFKNVVIAGHSLGGYILPKFYEYLDDTEKNFVKSFVYLASPASKLEDLMVKQLEVFSNEDGVITGEEQQIIDQYRAVRDKIKTINKSTPNSNEIFLGAGVQYYQYLLDYDPIQSAGNITIPQLFLFAQNDKNVDVAECNLWKTALVGKTDTDVKMFDGLNHYFMPGTGYPEKDASKPANIPIDVVNYIIQWLE